MTQAARLQVVPVFTATEDQKREWPAEGQFREDGPGYDVGLSPPGVPYVPTDEDVEAVLAEFDGDPKRAIRALLEDIGVLADDRRKNVSYGSIYGHLEVVK
ncbi:hypothetical protein [Phreatobacter stygius]|uniref:Uncharacterized protein n=1 Tax=Phreatobacter stygius TaxID=1940610 RepID=A0A4D7BAS8_9HYPH|nr:hypothetical protein [Phreatobacter stygius]QCI67238.1 hypothetical protein E8M01_25190 [Phreatobacter stygius]